ncbi:MAG: pirin family protein [Bacteroidetes bacterium]|nr:pirin family protein [Bacteroidota bacterium]
MKYTLHKSGTRGYYDHGWLKTKHTFSFASYHNPQRIRFGLLRVLNDDIVEAGEGFGTHPHDNMEIVSIPISGALEHKDSMGHVEVIRPGEVQCMSAGSGITHSEYNHSEDEPVNFLQIWVFPKEKNIKPRYDQKYFDPEERKNRIQTVVSPDGIEGALWINQDAVFSLTEIEKGKEVSYETKFPGNGIYVFLIEGRMQIGDTELEARDGIGVESGNKIILRAEEYSYAVIIEIPMR